MTTYMISRIIGETLPPTHSPTHTQLTHLVPNGINPLSK